MFELRLRGVGCWAPGVPDWAQARALLATGGDWPDAGNARAAPALMPANERRRAPDSVLLALAVAEQACADAGVAAGELASVFASIYGDLPINDYLCAILRDEPGALSPTKFHNSVHNAPSGYWSIATGAMAATSSVAAGPHSFAAGLLEAASQVVESDAPVLLVAYDVPGTGPIAQIACVSRAFGCALVLDRDRGDSAAKGARFCVSTAEAAAPVHSDQDANTGPAALTAGNPIAAGAIGLLSALATAAPWSGRLALSPTLDLVLELSA